MKTFYDMNLVVVLCIPGCEDTNSVLKAASSSHLLYITNMLTAIKSHCKESILSM